MVCCKDEGPVLSMPVEQIIMDLYREESAELSGESILKELMFSFAAPEETSGQPLRKKKPVRISIPWVPLHTIRQLRA